MRIVEGAATAVVLALLLAWTVRAEPGDRWAFAQGRPDEQLFAAADEMPAATIEVSLPHRVLAPNTALWYRNDMALPDGQALLVQADDGAQVFVDGRRLDQVGRWFLLPDDEPSASPRRRVVTVRVLNNAMRGGLTAVAVVPPPSAEEETLRELRLPDGLKPIDAREVQARLPGPRSPCTFTAWADSQGGWKTFRALSSLMAAWPLDFSVGAGDLVNDGSNPASWRAFVEAVAPLAARVPVVPVPGNHDYDGFYNDLRSTPYLDLFRPDDRQSWFAWSCGPARFVALDLNREFPIGISRGTDQERWLEQEIASRPWRSAAWRVLVVHQPPYSRSWEGYDGDAATRTIVERLASGHGLDLVIAGHSHAYEHLQRMVGPHPVHVLITGGAGGTLEPPIDGLDTRDDTVVLAHHVARATVTATELSVEAVDQRGAVIDRWRLRR